MLFQTLPRSERPAWLFLILIILAGCVERYDPEEEVLKTGILVINAHLTDRPGVQQIKISRSTTLRIPKYEPVQGCYAVLVRDDGTDREFSDAGNGKYGSLLEGDFLQTGMSYRLHVITPDGNEYESDFEMLRPVPEIDSVYYAVEPDPDAEENGTRDGLGVRFYCDFTYDSDAYRYLRWDMVETYEFHNPPLYNVSDRAGPLPEASRCRICWITNENTEISTLSLTTLEKGSYIRKQLNFVPNIPKEQKLHWGYSLLVRQYSLSEEAFNYWDELKITSQESGTFFDRQPAILHSNICNIRNEDEVVLGYFSMSGMTERRVFAQYVEGIDTKRDPEYCAVRIPGPGYRLSPDEVYACTNAEGAAKCGVVKIQCVDCRLLENSTHIRPDFW
ncbi:MAG TPA: DUF4249 domain-containing protein [Bacteroides sp.]|nr:DUF4249 domain-containing protein [Bacteroides sp.]